MRTIDHLKGALRRTPLYQLWCARRERLLIRAWEMAGRPLPPPDALKQRNLRRAAKAHRLRILVETGTFAGNMVEAMRRHFDRIHSIELSREYHVSAKGRFAAFPHIDLLFGDSGDVLRRVVENLDGPALFWLDGHYSGGISARGAKDTPIIEELDCIFPSRFEHMVIIDDARLFGNDPAYPSIAEIREHVLSRDGRQRIVVVDDAIHISPWR
jgi:hypothetical protein